VSAKVVLLRPYVSSAKLRGMARERRIAAMWALLAGRMRRRRRFLVQAEELESEASRAEHWENECELTRLAVDRILAVARREGA
jgi:hypothetical protein